MQDVGAFGLGVADAEQPHPHQVDQGEQQERAHRLHLVDRPVPGGVVPVGPAVHRGTDVGVHQPYPQRGGPAPFTPVQRTRGGDVEPPVRRLDEPAARRVLDRPGADQRLRGPRGEVATHQRHIAERKQAQHARPHDRAGAPVDPLVVDPVRRRLDGGEEVHQRPWRIVQAVDPVLQGLPEQRPSATLRQVVEQRDDGVGEGILRLGELAQTFPLPLGPPDVPRGEEPGGEAESALPEQFRVRQPRVGLVRLHALSPALRIRSDNKCCHFVARPSSAAPGAGRYRGRRRGGRTPTCRRTITAL